jgi:dipeptidyl aminopeptidase/acylaminoacyl peptidase
VAPRQLILLDAGAGLREFGVPVEFVSYPREGHQAREPAHVADQRERVLRFLASHLEVP